MKTEYDFAGGQRGAFFRKGARLIPPVHLGSGVLDDPLERAQRRGESLNSVVNQLLRKAGA